MTVQKETAMRITRFVVPCLVAFGLLMVGRFDVHAKPEYSKKEKTGCTTCHVSIKSKELNDTGKGYKETKILPKK
jgi:hypothetical protein